MRRRTIVQLADAKHLEDEIRRAAQRALAAIRRLVEQNDALHLLEAVKFHKIGRDPMESTRRLNLIEQVNQTFTALVSVRAVEYLFDHHSESAPFLLNLGTAPGPDIASRDGLVAAEVFAATHAGSNQKLNRDIAKVRQSSAKHRYVFFHCPGDHAHREVDGVHIVALDLRHAPDDDLIPEGRETPGRSDNHRHEVALRPANPR